MTELQEMTDGKLFLDFLLQLKHQIKNGEDIGGTIVSHVLHECQQKATNDFQREALKTVLANKTKLIVVGEHTLAYTDDNYFAGILHASVLKGSPHPPFGSISIGNSKFRLATEKDFEDFRVSFEGYKNDPQYEYDKG